MVKNMLQQKKHIEFDGDRSVDFERDVDGDVSILLHLGSRNLDRVSGDSSQTYLCSYFAKYGFDANSLWLELQLFKGLTKAMMGHLAPVFAEPSLPDDLSLPLDDRIVRSIGRLDRGAGVEVSVIASDLRVEEAAVAQKIPDLLHAVRVYHVSKHHYSRYL